MSNIGEYVTVQKCTCQIESNCQVDEPPTINHLRTQFFLSEFATGGRNPQNRPSQDRAPTRWWKINGAQYALFQISEISKLQTHFECYVFYVFQLDVPLILEAGCFPPGPPSDFLSGYESRSPID